MKNRNLNIARVLLIIGLKSWQQTITHIGDEDYTLMSEFEKGKYHDFREAI